MALLVVLIILLGLPWTVQAAIDCADAGATEIHEAAPADPRDVSYTTPSGSDLITLVGVIYRDATSRTGTTATMGGNAMSAVSTAIHNGVATGASFFYLVNPPSGTNTVSVNWVSAAPLHGHIIIWTCSGVDQVTPFRSNNGASGTGTAVSVTLGSINTGDVAVDIAGSDDVTSLSVGANQTVIHQGASASSEAGASYQAGADGGVMSWTIGASDDWAILAGALIPSVADVGGDVIWFY